MSPWLIAPIAWILLSMVVTPIGIGKPRKPLTGGAAAVIVAVQLMLIFCLLKAGGAL